MAKAKKTSTKKVSGTRLGDIITARPLLEKIANKEMDADVALEFAKFTRGVLEAIQEVEKVRVELFQKYGERQEDGNVKIKEENGDKFQEELKKVLDKTVEIEPFEAAKLGIKVAPADFINMLSLFK